MSTARVKRCPFCNSHALQLDCNQVAYWVHCRGCLANGPIGYEVADAVSRWNYGHNERCCLVGDPKSSNRNDTKEVEL